MLLARALCMLFACYDASHNIDLAQIRFFPFATRTHDPMHGMACMSVDRPAAARGGRGPTPWNCMHGMLHVRARTTNGRRAGARAEHIMPCIQIRRARARRAADELVRCERARARFTS